MAGGRNSLGPRGVLTEEEKQAAYRELGVEE